MSYGSNMPSCPVSYSSGPQPPWTGSYQSFLVHHDFILLCVRRTQTSRVEKCTQEAWGLPTPLIMWEVFVGQDLHMMNVEQDQTFPSRGAVCRSAERPLWSPHCSNAALWRFVFLNTLRLSWLFLFVLRDVGGLLSASSGVEMFDYLVEIKPQ